MTDEPSQTPADPVAVAQDAPSPAPASEQAVEQPAAVAPPEASPAPEEPVAEPEAPAPTPVINPNALRGVQAGPADHPRIVHHRRTH